MYEVFFDIETKHWFDETGNTRLEDLGVSIVSMYVRPENKMYSFFDHQFDQMWRYFRKADRIVGFNTLKFDVPVLAPIAPPDFPTLNHFDIFDEIKKSNNGFASSLNSIARGCLGRTKNDTGENATVYWHRGDSESLGLLKKYCEMDVELTRDVYDYIVTHKSVKYIDRWNTPREVSLNFSYPENSAFISQPSLF
ncbi:ribonuclease H-like domain-containing protein [Candidatus Amesbacteria bacterium]|nr:ribonuclease H-like domain-containing protein [Candidatus Amesbacteria bacterium]